ncbi:MAG: 3-dehydroquinate synthase [Thermomicrobiales bacterium]
MASERIVLIGFSGTGKSTVARLLADRLGWSIVDTDDEIVREVGQDIPAIFADLGEPAFRAIERRHLLAAVARKRVVVATGGGAVVDPVVWDHNLLGANDTLVVALDAAPETTLARLREQESQDGAAVSRPLLQGDDPQARIASLKARRQHAYDRADITLIVDSVPSARVAEEIECLLRSESNLEPPLTLDAPGGSSKIYIAPGLSSAIGDLIRRRWPTTRRCWVVTDANVSMFHLEPLADKLREVGLRVESRAVPPGEHSKSLTVVESLYDWLLDAGIERSDVVIALGGGVIGDLAGFVAATCLRGVGLVQMPTSLLAMVDSSVGGKTGVNHRAGKNLIGAFYQPPLVVVDPALLGTLPKRELDSGWAEVLKHGVIQPSTPQGECGDLLSFYERNAERLIHLGEPALTYAIRRNVALKAAVVEADERESGIRAYLNFGHTLGHAIEAAEYRYLHGEAIAAGMRAAFRIGQELGTVNSAAADRIEALIARYGLPTEVEVDEERVLSLVGSDKKRAAGNIRWVLPLDEGGVTIRDNVPDAIVRAALAVVARRKPAVNALPS